MPKSLKIILIILGVIALLAVAFTIFISQTGKNLEALPGLPIEDVDLSAVPDGTYKGSYRAFPVAVEVEVTVQDIKMTDDIGYSNKNCSNPHKYEA